MTLVQELGEFTAAARWRQLSSAAQNALRIRMLDSLGCAIGALGQGPLPHLRNHTREMDATDHCSLLGGGRAAPDRAAFYNGALVRYLDFNDSYLAAGETCHPSDNVAPVLAAAEFVDADGADLLAALAVAYQVQCRLADVAPVRAAGFDHTTQGAYAAAAGAARALGLDGRRTAHAVAISGTANNALRVTRTGTLSHWKGLAYPNTAMGAVHAALLARRGITGPLEVFEGNKGFMDAIAGPFRLRWQEEDLERVTATVLKKYNAEVHSQSAIEGLLELQAAHGFAAADVESVRIEIFHVAWNIIGGGEEGAKTQVGSKEEADHSLPYMAAVALLDGALTPRQYRPERIGGSDVQALLRRVAVVPQDDLSARFPRQMPCRLEVLLKNGIRLRGEKTDYEGFTSRPMDWDGAYRKFRELTTPRLNDASAAALADAVLALERGPVRDFTRRLQDLVQEDHMP